MYMENGCVVINPCSFEEGHNIVYDGNRASQKGRMVTDDDGTSHFYPYAKDSGSRYRILYKSDYSVVKEARGGFILQLRFPKRLGKRQIVRLLREEQHKMEAFMKGIRIRTRR